MRSGLCTRIGLPDQPAQQGFVQFSGQSSFVSDTVEICVVVSVDSWQALLSSQQASASLSVSPAQQLSVADSDAKATFCPSPSLEQQLEDASLLLAMIVSALLNSAQQLDSSVATVVAAALASGAVQEEQFPDIRRYPAIPSPPTRTTAMRGNEELDPRRVVMS